MERPPIIQEELDRLSVDKPLALRELNSIAEVIVNEVMSLKSTSISKLDLTSLVALNENSSSQEIKQRLNQMIDTIISKISPNGSLDYEGMGDVIKIIESLRDINEDSLDAENVIQLIDSSLIDVAALNVPLKTKTKFFDSLKAIIEDNLNKSLLGELTEANAISPRRILPVSAYYVLNIDDSLERIQKLIDLKRLIKNQLTAIFNELRNDSSETILNKYGDYIVDSEIEEYENERNYSETAPQQYITNSIPQTSNTDSTAELEELLNSDNNLVSTNKLRIAKIQLLRIYREYINTLISDSKITNIIIDEQLKGAFEDGLRIGGLDSPLKEIQRRKANRRIALFESAHEGFIKSSEINFALEAKNLLPVSPEIIDLWLDGEQMNVEAMDIKSELSDEQLYMLNSLLPLKDTRIPQSKTRAISIDDKFRDLPDGIPERIIKRSLELVGVYSPIEVEAYQIESYDRKLPTDGNIKTYGVKISPSGNVAVNHKYRLFILSESYQRSLKALMTSIAHEFGHIFQRIARDNSTLPGLSKLSTIGRSDILAESGAIKMDSIMQSLFGDTREINTYHFDALRLIIEGKNYWEIFNEIFKILSEKNSRNNEGQSKAELIKITLRTISRAYGNLGSTGSETNQGRYPSTAGLLAYTYQGMDKYSDLPFYVSGIPSHRINLKNFIPQPYVGTTPITETLIIGKIIEATYEVLKDTGILSN